MNENEIKLREEKFQPAGKSVMLDAKTAYRADGTTAKASDSTTPDRMQTAVSGDKQALFDADATFPAMLHDIGPRPVMPTGGKPWVLDSKTVIVNGKDVRKS